MPALHRDGPVHHIHDVSGDGHAQAGALNAAGGGVVLSLEGLKDMGDKLLAHPDAGVLHAELISGVSRRGPRLLRHADADHAPRWGVLDGIAQQVEQNLVQTQAVAADVLVNYVHRVHIQLQLLGMDIRMHDVAQPVEDVGQGTGLLLQGHLPALNSAHIQHIVDEAEQMVAGCHNFFQIALHLVPLVDVGGGQGCKADNGVHGGADIVRHVGQESAFGLVGPVCLHQGVLQQVHPLDLPAGILVHIPKAQHHLPAVLPLARPDRFHLEIAELSPAHHPVVEDICISLVQPLAQILEGHRLAHQFPVLLIDTSANIAAQALPDGPVLHKYFVQNVKLAVVDPQRPALAGIQIKMTHQVVVHTQGLDQLGLPLLVFRPLPLLPEPLGCIVQQEALVEQLSALLHQLDIGHHMENLTVGMLHPVFHVGAVSHLGQRLDAVPELGLVLRHHRGGDHLEAAVQQFLLRAVAQYLKGRPVDADDSGAVQCMAHHAAVHGGKEVFQLPVFIHNLLFVSPLLCNVNGQAHGTHHAAVAVVQWGLVGGQQTGPSAGLDGLL